MKLSLETKRLIKRLQMLTTISMLLISIVEGVRILSVFFVCLFFYFLIVYRVELGRHMDHPEFLYPEKMRDVR